MFDKISEEGDEKITKFDPNSRQNILKLNYPISSYYDCMWKCLKLRFNKKVKIKEFCWDRSIVPSLIYQEPTIYLSESLV